MSKATRDLREKMQLEKLLSIELDSYFRRVADKWAMFARNRMSLDMSIFDDELKAILLDHYARVQERFDNQLRKRLPKEVRSTQEEDRLINSAFKQFSVIRASLIAKQVNATTQKNISKAEALAQTFDTETQQVVDGVVVSKKARLIGFELILTGKSILRRILRGRVPAIIMTETQTPAETAKLTEAEVLSDLNPSILGGTPQDPKVTKIWVAIFDGKTRDTHIEADGQERRANQSFSVGGFALKVPGDSSQGAPLKETANCRCAAVFNEEQIVAVRFDRLTEESFIAIGR